MKEEEFLPVVNIKNRTEKQRGTETDEKQEIRLASKRKRLNRLREKLTDE